MPGDRKHGAEIFARTCLQCHAMQGEGARIGPDLSGIATHSRETLLVDILDPSRQVLPDFVSYTVVTTDGETLTGLIMAESTASVTVRRPNIPDATIQRSQIKELRADGKSLMPGVAGHSTDIIEHPRLIADRLVQFAGLVGKDNVIAGTDCGVGSRGWNGGAQWRAPRNGRPSRVGRSYR